jgi:two-component system sensor histidine kinase KdpD
MSDLFGNSKGIVGYLTALGSVALVTLILAPFHGHINATTIALALLLVVLITATFFGSRPALLASLLGVLCFNFFFLPPFYTLSIAAPENWIAFGAFSITAIIAGQLSSYARRRAAESEERRKEIERLYHELQAAFEQASQAEALRRSERLKSALLDAVTHDLRTPLTSIKASATTLLEDLNARLDGEFSGDNDSLQLDDEGRREFLEIIDEESDRLNKFIEGMVSLARVKAGAAHLRKSRIGVEEIINNAIDRAKNRLDAHEVRLEIEPELPIVSVDADSIAEVVYTLLDNAAKYSPKASRIRILARRAENEAIEIAVEDEGRGIPREMRGKVFDKFFRADETDAHTTQGGLGLGLAIARGIVESQGGKIWIEDGQSGFKTRFTFQIPIGDEVEK